MTLDGEQRQIINYLSPQVISQYIVQNSENAHKIINKNGNAIKNTITINLLTIGC